jgi:serine/threonine protein kinase
VLTLKGGQRFGEWTLEKRLGEGGNGVVWRVHHDDGRLAAMKFLAPWQNEDDGTDYYDVKRYDRFRDEVQAFSKCQDIKGVLPLLDHYIPDVPDLDDPPWLVLALAIPLEKALGEDYSLVEAVKACAAIAHTLSVVHSRDYSHRDIKPDNLFWYDDSWCLGDFGLAKYKGKLAQTSVDERVGPRFYIPDEMLNDAANADGKKADVYELAKTLWKLGTKQAYPLQGPISAGETATRLSTYATDPRAFKLDTILEQSTRRDPAQRLRIDDLARELDSWLTPPTKDTSDVTSLTYLVPRIEVIQGGVRERAEAINRNNAEVDVRVRAFLDGFNESLEKLGNQLKRQLSIDFQHTLTRQGYTDVWLAEVGPTQLENAIFYQNDITALFQKPGGSLYVTLLIGFCVRLENEMTDDGRILQMIGPVRAAAAITLNQTEDIQDVLRDRLRHQTRIAGGHKDFVLGGPIQDEVTQEFITLINQSFAGGVEMALAAIEGSN